MNKDLRLDLIRTMAIIFVVLIHSMGLLNDASETKGILIIKGFYSLIHVGVPLFVMLSGALLLGKEEPINLFFKKRFHRVLIPFFSWSIIVSIIHFFQNGGRNLLNWPLIFTKDLFGNGVHGIYWYVYMILGLYMLTPILRSVAKNAKLLAYSIIVCFGLYYLQFFLPEFSLANRFQFQNLLFIGYFLTGYFLYTANFNNLTNQCLKIIFIILYLVQILFILIKINFSLFPFIAICLFGLVLSIAPPKNKRVQVAISTISKYSYGIYLSHFILISVILKTQVLSSFPLPIEPIIMGIIVISLDIALLYFIKKTKLSKFFM